VSASDGDLRADVRAWLGSRAPMSEPLAAALRIPSLPMSLAQNDVLDVVDRIIGSAPGVVRRRWVPDWFALADIASPLDEQRLYVDLVRRDPRYAETLPHTEVAVYTISRGDGPTLMLNGHVDVVPADNQDWTRDAFDPRIVDGRMIARGAMDMKGGLIAAASAFAYLAEHWQGTGTIVFAAVPEEETGGDGTLAVLAAGCVPDAVVFTEPTDLLVVHRHVGIQAFDVSVEGRPGGMLRRSWGRSAAPAIARAAVALDELEAERSRRAKRAGGYDEDDLPGFINYTLRAGDWIATRAAVGRIEGLMGILPGETQEEAAAELTEAVRVATAGDDLETRVTVPPGGHRGADLPVGHRLVRSFASGIPDTGPGSPTRAGTMVCDAKIAQGGGWCPAIVLGPIGGGLHAADEWVDLASISTLVEMLVLGAARFLDGQDHGRGAD
jgi:acetylornithine deacetylase